MFISYNLYYCSLKYVVKSYIEVGRARDRESIEVIDRWMIDGWMIDV